ncbi:MAG: glycosyltransferase [Flavobacteriales bacterium]|nr:glycosyltransferase [Flavobacteriales bacterium]
MHILFLTTQLPYPPKSGGLIKSWNLLRHWCAHHQVSLIHPLKNDEHLHVEELKGKLDLEHHFAVPVDRPRTALNLLKSYLGHASLNVYRNYDARIKAEVRGIAPKTDLIFIDHYEMGQYIPESYTGKVVLHEHNAEFIMWQRLAELQSNPLKRAILERESARILKAEKRYASRADQVWCAPNDAQELTKQGVSLHKIRFTYHLGEDEMLEAAAIDIDETELSLLYVGTLSWEANVDGLLWFLQDCWSSLKVKHPELRLDIVGKSPDKRLLQAAEVHADIHFHGFIDDVVSLYQKSRVFIVPLRFGSGIKVKVLNALYRGIPLVTTDIGTEGLDTVSGQHLFEASEAEDFIEHTSQLLTDHNLWERMRDNARSLASRYTWAQLLNEHDGHLEELT